MIEHDEFDQDAKRLDSDLDAVSGQISLCREMMKHSSGISEDEALKDLIGFLEACSDRMSDLIEAGASGILSEECFARVLTLNDALQKTLTAEKEGKVLTDEDFDEKLIDTDTPEAVSSSSAANDVLELGTPTATAEKVTMVEGIPFTVHDDYVHNENPFDSIPAAQTNNVDSPDYSPPPVPPGSTDTTDVHLDNFLSSLNVSNGGNTTGTDRKAGIETTTASMQEIELDDNNINSFFAELAEEKK
jgi:hypothetical protein